MAYDDVALGAQFRGLGEYFKAHDAERTKIRNEVQSLRAAAASPVRRHRLEALFTSLTNAVVFWNDLLAKSGIDRYARDYYEEAGAFNFTARVTDTRAQAIVLRNWVFDNYPKSADAEAAWKTFARDRDTGAAIPLEFTAAELTGFITEADALLALL